MDGICIVGGGDEACGSSGADCVACPAGSVCYKAPGGGLACLRWQSLDCGPANCPGCCVTTGYCYLGLQDTACGHAGQGCQQCSPDAGTGTCTSVAGGGGACSGGQPCGFSNCFGCCVGNVCLPGTSNEACGVTCEPCSATQDCALTVDGGIGSFWCNPVVPCDPSTCDGCCDGLVCAVGTQQVACGTGGVTCLDCDLYGQTCKAGACP